MYVEYSSYLLLNNKLPPKPRVKKTTTTSICFAQEPAIWVEHGGTRLSQLHPVLAAATQSGLEGPVLRGSLTLHGWQAGIAC